MNEESVTASDTSPEVLAKRFPGITATSDNAADAEPQICQACSQRLGGLYRKLTGA